MKITTTIAGQVTRFRLADGLLLEQFKPDRVNATEVFHHCEHPYIRVALEDLAGRSLGYIHYEPETKYIGGDLQITANVHPAFKTVATEQAIAILETVCAVLPISISQLTTK